ncbi:MAG: hypothetical protein CSYNP_02834 [Syntrophus sp. SKADARSKE-3]|nr:hypothetical protein [Syntrophus sp. SKADARSKE-3]
MTILSFVSYMDPTKYMTMDNYASLWNIIYQSLLQGFWGRLIAIILMFLAFWYAVRRENMSVAVVLILLAAATMYGATVVDLMSNIF